MPQDEKQKQKQKQEQEQEQPPEKGGRSRLHSWGLLIFFSLLIWAFGAIIGPAIRQSIPTARQMDLIVEERDINSAAYFYTEIEASYDGEQYLRDSLILAGHRDAKWNPVLLSGVVLCILILCLGYRYLPND